MSQLARWNWPTAQAGGAGIVERRPATARWSAHGWQEPWESRGSCTVL